MSVVRRIPESKFAIPVPKDLPAPDGDATYRWASERLKTLGFVLWAEREAPRERASYEGRDDPCWFSLWVHPKGLLATMDSISWAKSGEDQRINSLKLWSERDCGYGMAGSAMARSGGGTSNYAATADGATRYHTDFDGYRNGWCLESTLIRLQETAPFVPFDQWSDSRWPVFLPSELVVRPEEGDLGVSVEAHQQLDSKDYVAGVRKLCAQAPFPGVDQILARHALEYRNTRGLGITEFDWRPVEQTLNYLGRTVGMAQRYPPPKTREWMEQAVHWCDPRSDVSTATLCQDAQKQSVGPGGINLAGMLAWSLASPGRDADKQPYPQSNPERLLALLRTVDTVILMNWCDTPDDQGYTLPLLLLQASLSRETVPSSWTSPVVVPTEWFLKAFEVLLERVPPTNLGLWTEQRSLRGLVWEEHPPRDTMYQAEYRWAHDRFTTVLQYLKEAGLEVERQPLRVQLPVEEKMDPSRSRLVSIALPADWSLEALHEQWANQGTIPEARREWLAQLQAQALTHAMEAVTSEEPLPTSAARRPRL